MTGAEHYREAERLTEVREGRLSRLTDQDTALAQVHATLALAAATYYHREADYRRYGYGDEATR